MKVKCKCPFCGAINVVNVDAEKYGQYKFGGDSIQKVLPNMSANDRELLMTGICPKCWPA